MTDVEISRELREMKDAESAAWRFYLEIGLNPKPSPEVASRVASGSRRQWFGHVKHAIEEGQRWE